MTVSLKRPLLAAAIAMSLAPAANAVDLVGVYTLAADNDPTLLAAAARRAATGENPRQAWANLLPNLSGSAATRRGDTQTDLAGRRISNTDTDDTNLQIDLNQSLYRQSNYEQLDIARGQDSQAEADYRRAFEEFLLRVSERYFAVLTAVDELTFSEAEETALQRQFEQAEQRFEVGLTAVTDVHEARASYDRARARTIIAQNNLEDALEGLRELTGRYFESVEPLEEDLPLVPPVPQSSEEWVDLAVVSNPALLAARYNVEVAEAAVRLERSGHFPTLDLFASYSNFEDNEQVLRDDDFVPIGVTTLEVDDFVYGLRLDVPIYQGGSVSSRTRQARHLLDAAMQEEEIELRRVVRNTENSYRAVMAGIEQVQAFGQAVVSAESALEATQAGFEVGTRTIVDVLLAEQRYFQSLRDLSQVRHQYILDHLRLKASAGLLEEQDLVAVNGLLE